MTDYVFVCAGGEEIPVMICERAGLKNITLRPKIRPHREIHISKPLFVSDAAVLRFLESKRSWVDGVYSNAPPRGAVVPGMRLSFLGREVILQHDPSRRSNGYSDDGTALVIGGAPDMFERRVRDFIKDEFLRELKRMIHSAPREYWPRRIAVRDTVSRWGSCSSTGTMSFSWRLAFAPSEVMRYVVMHELAHQKYMDHSPAFWTQVRALYGFGVERAKRWLNQRGGELHRYF